MRADNQKQLRVMRNVINLGEKYSSEINPVPILQTSYARIGELIGQIEVVEQEKRMNVLAIADEKDSKKRELCKYSDILNDVLYVKATIENNPNLAQAMDKSFSDLYFMHDEDALNECDAIYSTALPVEQDLVSNFGLEQSVLPTIKGLIGDIRQMKSNKMESVEDRAVSVVALEKLFDEAWDIITSKIDPMMKIFKTKNPELYVAYLKSRVIYD